MSKFIKVSESDLRKIISSELQKTPKTELQNQKWLSRRETCNQLKISYPTLYKYIDSGMLTPHKVGTRVFFLASDIEELIQNSKIV